MRRTLLVITILISGLAIRASAEVRNLGDILVKASSQQEMDLGNILKQIRLVPAKDPESGKSVFKVVWVEKGSIFEREGIKKNDLVVATGGFQQNGRSMELKNTLKGNTNPDSERE